jgi:hypothetical protein
MIKKYISILLLFLTLFSCSAQQPAAVSKVVEKPKYVAYDARVTYYAPCARWGEQVADPKTPKAVRGVTVAAHPDFPFGTVIKIPTLSGKIGDGVFVVQDRGSAVTRKTAAAGKSYVFDVFVKDAAELHKMAMKKPMTMRVYVKQP